MRIRIAFSIYMLSDSFKTRVYLKSVYSHQNTFTATA